MHGIRYTLFGLLGFSWDISAFPGTSCSSHILPEASRGRKNGDTPPTDPIVRYQGPSYVCVRSMPSYSAECHCRWSFVRDKNGGSQCMGQSIPIPTVLPNSLSNISSVYSPFTYTKYSNLFPLKEAIWDLLKQRLISFLFLTTAPMDRRACSRIRLETDRSHSG